MINLNSLKLLTVGRGYRHLTQVKVQSNQNTPKCTFFPESYWSKCNYSYYPNLILLLDRQTDRQVNVHLVQNPTHLETVVVNEAWHLLSLSTQNKSNHFNASTCCDQFLSNFKPLFIVNQFFADILDSACVFAPLWSQHAELRPVWHFHPSVRTELV